MKAIDVGEVAAVARRHRGCRGGGMTAITTAEPSPADRLRELAAAVRRLVPDRRDPEQFHCDKDEVVAELRRLARQIEVVMDSAVGSATKSH